MESLKSYLNLWLDMQRPSLAPSTEVGYERLIEKYVPEEIPLEGLSPLHILQIIAVPTREGHTRTAQLLYVLLRSACNAAVESGVLSRNPVAGIKRPKHTRQEASLWSADQIKHFLSCQSDSPLYAVWLLALVCGLRRGELIGLRWLDVNFTDGLIQIRNQRMRVKRQLIDKEPKSESGRRTLCVPAPVLTALRRLHASQGLTAVYVCPMSPEALSRALDAAIQDSGLPRVTLHGLRHSMATAMIGAGCNPKTLQGILGHAHYQTTADLYCHRDPAAEGLALDALRARLEIV